MRSRRAAVGIAGAGVLVVAAAYAIAAPTSRASTELTIWSETTAFGGASYGASAQAPAGALVTLHRELELGSGEVRIPDVPLSVDASSVQLVADGVSVLDQRFVPGAVTPDEILARHIGNAVTVVTTKGDLSGVLRGLDAQNLAVEVGTGDQRHLQLLRRDGYVLDVKLPPGPGVERPSLVWHVAAKHPGKQPVSITYRADGLTWMPDYFAVLDDATHTLDLTAWAAVHNATTAAFDDAALTLVESVAPHAGIAPRYRVPSPVRLGAGETVQVSLLPPHAPLAARQVVVVEPEPDESQNFQAFPATDCNQLNGQPPTGGRSVVALELDTPNGTPLPDGRVRLYRRGAADKLELVSEDVLRFGGGSARIQLAEDNDVSSSQRSLACTVDEHAHTIREKLEITVDNKGKAAVDALVRAFLFRWPVVKLESEDVRGTAAGGQTREYRVHVAAGGHKTVTYAAVYSW